MARTKTKPGPKLKYNSAAELQRAIDAYFEDCKGRPVITEDGEYQLNKWGRIVYEGEHPPTSAGLALWLGYTNRKALLDYKEREEFKDIIEAAKTRIFEYNERMLYTIEGQKGAQYALSFLFGVGKEEREAQKTNVVILPEVVKEPTTTSYDEPKE